MAPKGRFSSNATLSLVFSQSLKLKSLSIGVSDEVRVLDSVLVQQLNIRFTFFLKERIVGTVVLIKFGLIQHFISALRPCILALWVAAGVAENALGALTHFSDL